MREIGTYTLPVLAGLALCGLLVLGRAVRLAPFRRRTPPRPTPSHGKPASLPWLRRAVRTRRLDDSFEPLPGRLRVKLWRQELRQRPGEERN